MAKPDIRRDGDTWLLTWPDHQVGIGMERLRESSDGLHAEVTVESVRPDGNGRLLGPAKLNVLSTESQTRFSNTLGKRVESMRPEQWLGLVVQACAIVAKEYRAPSPTILLPTLEDDGPTQYLIPGLIPEGETSVMYGDGESNKSMLALVIAFCCATGRALPWGPEPNDLISVMILDWETNARTVRQRLDRIARGYGLDRMPADVPLYYRGSTRGGNVLRNLEDELPNLRSERDRLNIGLVIVDSIGFAMAGPLVEDQTARSAMQCLRMLAPATRLVVAHISNEQAKSQGKAKPFGSAFFWNGMRSGIEVRRAEEATSNNVAEVGLFHRKSNDGEHHQPIGLRVTFTDPTGPIAFGRTDIQEVPELADRTSLSSRLRAQLKRGEKNSRQLAEELEVKESVVAAVLRKMPDVTNLTPGGGGRGNVATWGLVHVQ